MKLIRRLAVAAAMLLMLCSTAMATELKLGEYYYIDLMEMQEVGVFNAAAWDDSWTCYGDQLTGDAKAIYQALETAFAADSVPIQTITYSDGTSTANWWLKYAAVMKESSDVDAAYAAAALAARAFTYDHPEYFWIRTAYSFGATTSGSTIYANVGFVTQPSCDTREKRDALQAELTPVVDQLLTETEDMSPVARLAYFDNWLSENNTYNREAAADGTYIKRDDTPWSTVGGLLGQYSPVCEGYAKAFQLLCKKIGVPCLEISGYAGGGHMWTAVQLDGEWYFCDPTWNDPGITSAGGSDRTHFLTPQPASHTADNDKLATPELTAGYFREWDLSTSGFVGSEFGSGDMLIALYDSNGKFIAMKTCEAFLWQGNRWRHLAPSFTAEQLKEAARAVRINTAADSWMPLAECVWID